MERAKRVFEAARDEHDAAVAVGAASRKAARVAQAEAEDAPSADDDAPVSDAPCASDEPARLALLRHAVGGG
jgi:hypothetical protein